MFHSSLRSISFGHYVRNFARFMGNDKIVNLDSSTLTGRIMNYLNPKVTELTPKTDFTPSELLNMMKYRNLYHINISNSNLITLINCLEDETLITSNRGFQRILELVDGICCSRKENMDTKQILSFLDAYMDLIPHRLTELNFYHEAINELFANVETLKGKDYMKFLFYVALMKKDAKSQKMLRKSLSVLNKSEISNLSSEELCIIANSAFKTSTKLNKNILYKIRTYLNDNLMILRDPAVFVTLIKCLRLNRYCDEDLLSTISCAIFFNKTFEDYTFQTYCHLLALYSDNLYHDEKLLAFITEKCMEDIKTYSCENVAEKKIRSKDLLRFLWGISNLNVTLSRDNLDIIVSRIIGFIESDELSIKSQIDIFWYLWILNYKCHRLVPYILGKKELMLKLPERSRQTLNQLLVCIYYEDRPLFNEFKMKPIGTNKFVLSQHLQDRPCLEHVFRALRTIEKKMKMRFELNYQIPHMNILGIIGYKNNIYKTVHIEVLDNFTTLKNSNGRPSGLMQTKLRILDGSAEGLITVKQEEVEDFTESQLEKFLEGELNLVC